MITSAFSCKSDFKIEGAIILFFGLLKIFVIARRGHPDAQDLVNARKWVRTLVRVLEKSLRNNLMVKPFNSFVNILLG